MPRKKKAVEVEAPEVEVETAIEEAPEVEKPKVKKSKAVQYRIPGSSKVYEGVLLPDGQVMSGGETYNSVELL